MPTAVPGIRRRGARLFAPAPAFNLRPLGALLAVAAVAAGTLLSLLRQPGLGALNTVWAEDGMLFLGDAIRSPLGALVIPYAGYYHAIPRLLAAFVPLAPPPAAAAALALAAAATTSALALLVYVASAAHLAWRSSRLLVAAVTIVVPVAQGEVPNSIANLHWPALYALFWVLLWTPSGRAGRILAPVVGLLVAGSDIIVAALLPLAYLRVLLRRDRYSTLLAAVLTAGWVVQLGGLLTGSTSRALTPDPVRWLVWYGDRVLPGTVFGEVWANRAAVGTGPATVTTWPALATIAWLLVALLVVLSAWLGRPNAALAAVAFGQSILLYGVPALLSAYPNPRYAAAPAMLLVAALVAMATPRPEHTPRPVRTLEPARDRQPAVTAALGTAGPNADRPVPRWIGAKVVPALPLVAVSVLLCATWIGNYRVDNIRARGPAWQEQIAIARRTCALRHPSAVDVPIAPISQPQIWVVRLPCDYLLR